MPYFSRNCDADELHLICRGEMIYETDFGNTEVGESSKIAAHAGVLGEAMSTQLTWLEMERKTMALRNTNSRKL